MNPQKFKINTNWTNNVYKTDKKRTWKSFCIFKDILFPLCFCVGGSACMCCVWFAWETPAVSGALCGVDKIPLKERRARALTRPLPPPEILSLSPSIHPLILRELASRGKLCRVQKRKATIKQPPKKILWKKSVKTKKCKNTTKECTKVRNIFVWFKVWHF